MLEKLNNELSEYKGFKSNVEGLANDLAHLINNLINAYQQRTSYTINDVPIDNNLIGTDIDKLREKLYLLNGNYLPAINDHISGLNRAIDAEKERIRKEEEERKRREEEERKRREEEECKKKEEETTKAETKSGGKK